MRKSATLLQLLTLQTCFFLFSYMISQSVTFLIGGHMTMACLSEKGMLNRRYQRNHRKVLSDRQSVSAELETWTDSLECCAFLRLGLGMISRPGVARGCSTNRFVINHLFI